jgi:succinylglutamate desuccinylase
MQRIIGEFSLSNPGPLLICIGGMHGNEIAGVEAIRQVFSVLEHRRETARDFQFNGTMVGFVGNVSATDQGVRFITEDLNRLWTANRIKQIADKPEKLLEDEERELSELKQTILNYIAEVDAPSVILLDLHTTSADGGIYTIVSDDKSNIEFATKLNSPVVLGILDELAGTTLHYFTSDLIGKDLISLCFEAGLHSDPLSIQRSMAVISMCLTIGGLYCVDESLFLREVEMLESYSARLPSVTRVVYRHSITQTDKFLMLPGFQNFDPVTEGQILAHDKTGPIKAVCNGFILMPLYQAQGNDGFFIVAAEN